MMVIGAETQMGRFVLISLAICALLVAGPSGAIAQSFNIDFGSPETAPAPAYAAVGLPGTWNAVGVLQPGARQPLVGLNGAPTAARIYQIGGVSMLVSDDPAITGDDAALLEDMFIGFNDPVDVCIWVEHLVPGNYEVLTYAMTPGDPNLMSSVRVDDGTPGRIMVGGSWSGAHVHGVTYARHTVPVSNGVIGLHSGLWDAEIQSGINGIQIRAVPAAGVEDLGASAVPWGMSVYPNPATPGQTQTIEVFAPVESTVELAIFDAGGRLMRREVIDQLIPARHRLVWDGRSAGGRPVPAGIYFLQLTGSGGETSRMKIIRVD